MLSPCSPCLRGSCTEVTACTGDRNALFCHDLVKKRTSDASTTTSTTPRRRRGRIVRYLIVAVGCVLIIDALVGDRGLLAMVKARQQYRSLEASLVRSRAENAQLREQARQLREDPQAIEDIARRELGLIRPGEKLFIIKDVK
jgi:cell division protein FtsB